MRLVVLIMVGVMMSSKPTYASAKNKDQDRCDYIKYVIESNLGFIELHGKVFEAGKMTTEAWREEMERYSKVAARWSTIYTAICK